MAAYGGCVFEMGDAKLVDRICFSFSPNLVLRFRWWVARIKLSRRPMVQLVVLVAPKMCAPNIDPASSW